MPARRPFARWLRSARPADTRLFRPVAEALEDRTTPATFLVKNTNDSGAFSLRDIITSLNASGDATNSITFAPSTFGAINLQSNLPTITKPVTITGPGVAQLTINGQGLARPFTVDDGLAGAIGVTITRLTIAGGFTPFDGGGVFNRNENLTLTDVVIAGNAAGGLGGGVYAEGGSVIMKAVQVRNNLAADGAGILNGGAFVSITGSVIDGNVATNANGSGGYFQFAGSLQNMVGTAVTNNQGGLGAGLYVTGGPATIITSLIAGNRATNVDPTGTVPFVGTGGGLAVNGGQVKLFNVTVSGNTANGFAGGVAFFGGGSSNLELRGCTVAFNRSDADGVGGEAGGGINTTVGAVVTSSGTIYANNANALGPDDAVAAFNPASANNLIMVDIGAVTGISGQQNGNLIGTPVSPMDPLLFPLAFNGGPTKTHALSTDSPAIDKGTTAGLPASAAGADGRGAPFVRVAGTAADIGAYELPAGQVPLMVTTVADEDDPTFDAAALSLREAVKLSGKDAKTVTFAPALNGKTVTLARGSLVIDRSVTVQGPGAGLMTVTGDGTFRLGVVDDGNLSTRLAVTLAGLTLTGGKNDPNTGGDQFGGGALRTFENVTLNGVVLTNNFSASDSGAIDHQLGDLVLNDCTVSNNTAGRDGGGIGVFGGTARLNRTTVSGNQSNDTFAFGGGGGVFVTNFFNPSTLIVTNSTISGNRANQNGGGILSFGSTLSVNNSTVAFNKADLDNTGGGFGGGIATDLFTIAGIPVTMQATLVAQNAVGTSGASPDIDGQIDGTFCFIGNHTGWNEANSSDNLPPGDPLLAPLANNGGPTQTHALLPGSPAVDAGKNPDNLSTDQRGTGFARVAGAAADIGAFEFVPNTAPQVAGGGTAGVQLGQSAGVTFTVSDKESAAALLTLTVVGNTNPAVTPAGGLTVSGAGGTRTLTVNTAGGQAGTSTVTVRVTDPGGLTADAQVTVTVTDPPPPPQPPQIGGLSGATIPFGQGTTVSFGVADPDSPLDQLLLTVVGNSNPAVTPAAGLGFGGGGGSRTLSVNAAGGQPGTSVLTVRVTDPTGLTADAQLTVTVGPPPAQPPQLAPIAGLTVTAGQTAGVGFAVADPDSPLDLLVLSVVGNSNPAVAPAGGLSFGGAGGGRSLLLNAAGAQPGTSTVTVRVTDPTGLTADRQVAVTVVPAPVLPQRPAVGAIPAVQVGAGQATSVAFTVADPDTPADQLAVTVVGNSNPGVVPTAGLTVGGAGGGRVLNVGTAGGQPGSTTVTVRVTDPTGLTADAQVVVTVTGGPTGGRPELRVGFPQFAAGADAGGGGLSFYNPDGSIRFSVAPFGPTFTGGVRAAAADLNGDGVAEVFAGTGPGGASRVVVLNGATQVPMFDTAPFEAAFLGGIFVAAGDVTGDGIPDLIVSPDQGGGPRIDVFSGAGFGRVASFFAFQDDPNFRGGARASVGDVNGDGVGDLVVSAGFGGGPRIATFDGKSVAAGSTNPARMFGDFFAFENTLRNGAFVAAGDLDGDGKADLVFGGGPGGGPRVTAFRAADLIASNTQTVLANFFGGDTGNRGGIRVGVKDLDGDDRADVVVGSGPGLPGRVTGYLGRTLAAAGLPPAAFDFAVPGANDGVFVG